MTSLNQEEGGGNMWWLCDGPNCNARLNMTDKRNNASEHRDWLWAYVPHGLQFWEGLQQWHPNMAEQHWCPKCGAVLKDYLLDGNWCQLDRKKKHNKMKWKAKHDDPDPDRPSRDT